MFIKSLNNIPAVWLIGGYQFPESLAGRMPFLREGFQQFSVGKKNFPLLIIFCSAKIFISEKNTNNTEKKLTIF
jgi:hypothetical protein